MDLFGASQTFPVTKWVILLLVSGSFKHTHATRDDCLATTFLSLDVVPLDNISATSTNNGTLMNMCLRDANGKTPLTASAIMSGKKLYVHLRCDIQQNFGSNAEIIPVARPTS